MAGDWTAIIAPAGYGKTHQIVQHVLNASGRVLVLTHTKAGVTALSRRLGGEKLERSRYELSTIASYCRKWAEAYPFASGYGREDVDGRNSGLIDYNRLYSSAATVFKKQWAQRVIKASYGQIIVDEYQDCTALQRDALFALAEQLSLFVYGDPMQAIFHWAGPLADVEDSAFNVTMLASEPYRWINAGACALGEEIARIREQLMPTLKGEAVSVDIRNDIPGLDVMPASGLWNGEIFKRVAGCGNESILYLTSHKAGQSSFCERYTGFQVNETIDCKDLAVWAERIESASGPARCLTLLKFADECFTNVKSELGSYFKRLGSESLDFSRIRKHPELGALLAAAADSKDYSSSYKVLEWVERSSAGFRQYRGQLFGEMKRALRHAAAHGLNLIDALRKTHGDMESYEARYPQFRRIASRTVLSKGLEYDTVIVDATTITDPRDFYVAISRCRKRLIIVADQSTLRFSGVSR